MKRVEMAKESDCNATSTITHLTALCPRIQDLTFVDVRPIALATGDHRAYYGSEIDEMLLPNPHTRSAAVEFEPETHGNIAPPHVPIILRTRIIFV